MIFPGEAAKAKILADYFHREGYIERQRDFFQKEFYKEANVKGRKVEIIIDAASGRRVIEVSGTTAKIPWAWAEKHNVKHELNDAEIYIPEIELLISYKMGAALGRSNKLKSAVGEEAAYMRSKVWKDVYDILSLFQKEIKTEKLAHFLKESRLDAYLGEIDNIVKRHEGEADFTAFYPEYSRKLKDIPPKQKD